MLEKEQTAVASWLTISLTEPSWLELSVLSGTSGVAGVDEVGRGALFGPVVAAAVILPNHVWSELIAAKIKDSKKLSSSRRTKLAQQICASARLENWVCFHYGN